MALTDMKLTPAEAKDANSCCAPDSDDGGPKYPYGLSINLDDEALAKLGITTLPAVGGLMRLTATVEVTSTSQYERQDEKEISINLQITAMELGATQAEPSAATVLYGGS